MSKIQLFLGPSVQVWFLGQQAMWHLLRQQQHLYKLWALTILLFLSAACTTTAGDSEGIVTLTPTLEPVPAPTAVTAGEFLNDFDDLVETTPTPRPTATPGPIQEIVSDVTNITGLNRIRFLGLSPEDWINLAISLLIFVAGLFVIVPLVYYLLRRVAALTKTRYDDALLDVFEPQVKWLLRVVIFQYATNRLTLLPAGFQQWLSQLYFTLYVVILTVMTWKFINRALTLYQKRTADEKKAEGHHQAFLVLLRRVALGLLIITALAIVLNNYGFNVTVPLTILLLGGLTLSIAAKDTLIDVIDGFVILFDRPFSIGDRIGIQGLDTWGDVVDIGTRTTRIRTLDNRLVIVPNSKLGRNLVVNYTYPDTRYRIETQLHIAYESDIEQVRRIISASVPRVEGVLADRPIDALLDEFGSSALIFRVRWWVHSYSDARYVRDKVHSALYRALGEAGIRLPVPIQDVNLKLDRQAVNETLRQ